MIFVALNEAAEKGELLLIGGGMCRFYRRRDGVTVIREIIVLPVLRSCGIGRRLVEDVLVRAGPGGTVRAKCPAAYASNGFWARMGFARVAEAGGVNTWERAGLYAALAPASA